MRVLIPILEAQIEVPVLKTAINSTFQEVGFEATEEQYQCVYYSLTGENVFLSLPTGSGKSLCNGLLPAVYKELRSLLTGNSVDTL